MTRHTFIVGYVQGTGQKRLENTEFVYKIAYGSVAFWLGKKVTPHSTYRKHPLTYPLVWVVIHNGSSISIKNSIIPSNTYHLA